MGEINMNAREIMQSADFKRCADFHGHICPGLSIGYKAAKAGMKWLDENRSEDEEIVAIIETDGCPADAVQVLTGCTFGKGNFFHRDYGKMVLTLLSRNTGKGVRLSAKGSMAKPDAEHMALIQKMINDGLSAPEQERFEEFHQQRACIILEAEDEDLFDISPINAPLPARARIEPSEPCTRCGEPVMKSKLETVAGEKICRGCLA